MPECLSGTKFKWCKGPGSFGAKCQDCSKVPVTGGGGVSTKPPPITPGKPPSITPGKPPLVVKQPVLIPVPPVRTVTPEPPPLTTGLATFTFYRAVRSGPATYFGRKGFQPRVPLELTQIRLMMKNMFDRTKHPIEVPSRAVILHEAYGKRVDWSPLDMVREIKKEKSDSTPQLSTDLQPECVGYAKGNYVFKIEYTGLFVDRIINNQRPSDLNPMVKPKLVMNRGSIDASDVFAFACGGNEVAFLTSIPLANIRAYHAPDSEEWRPLWADDGASLWETENVG